MRSISNLPAYVGSVNCAIISVYLILCVKYLFFILLRLCFSLIQKKVSQARCLVDLFCE